VQTLGQQVKNNPLALALIGTGIGWLMFSDRRVRTNGRTVDYDHQSELDYRGADQRLGAESFSETDEYDRTPDFFTEEDAGDDANRTARYTRSRLAGAQSWAHDTGRSMSDTAGDYASKAREAASRGAESISESYDAVRDRASEWASSSRRGAGRALEAGRRQASRAVDAGRRMFDQVQHQPLMLAGIGFALGAALGASLPRTQTEDEFMGETSEGMKESARSFGREQVEKAQTAAAGVAERGLDEAERGLDQTEQVANEAALVPSDNNHSAEQDRMAETAEGAFGTSRDDGSNR
jgi:hypothetical protein